MSDSVRIRVRIRKMLIFLAQHPVPDPPRQPLLFPRLPRIPRTFLRLEFRLEQSQ